MKFISHIFSVHMGVIPRERDTGCERLRLSNYGFNSKRKAWWKDCNGISKSFLQLCDVPCTRSMPWSVNNTSGKGRSVRCGRHYEVPGIHNCKRNIWYISNRVAPFTGVLMQLWRRGWYTIWVLGWPQQCSLRGTLRALCGILRNGCVVPQDQNRCRV